MSRAIDGFAPSTDSAAPSIDPSMAQQSVDRAAIGRWRCAIDRSDLVMIKAVICSWYCSYSQNLSM